MRGILLILPFSARRDDQMSAAYPIPTFMWSLARFRLFTNNGLYIIMAPPGGFGVKTMEILLSPPVPTEVVQLMANVAGER